MPSQGRRTAAIPVALAKLLVVIGIWLPMAGTPLARGQYIDDRRFAPAITVEEFSRYQRLLSLSEAQAFASQDLYRRYIEDFQAFIDNDYKRFEAREDELFSTPWEELDYAETAERQRKAWIEYKGFAPRQWCGRHEPDVERRSSG